MKRKKPKETKANKSKQKPPGYKDTSQKKIKNMVNMKLMEHNESNANGEIYKCKCLH